MNRRDFLKASAGVSAAAFFALLHREKFFDGNIANARLHDHAMTDAQVSQWHISDDLDKECKSCRKANKSNEVSGDLIAWWQDGKWHHVVQRYDETGSVVEEWVDGVRQRIM